MRRRRYISLFGLLFICAVAIYLFYPTDEKRIREVINNCEEAIVSEDIDELMKLLSYNYMDDYGNSYLQIKGKMQTVFRRLNEIEVERDIVKISIAEDHAEAELSVRVIASEGEDRGYIIGNAGTADRIKVFFEKSPYKWLITKVEGQSINKAYY